MNLLIDTALKGSILIAAAAIASYFLRGRSAAARHAAWTAAVIGHLALPALSVLMPEWRLPLIPSPSWMETSASLPSSVPTETQQPSVTQPIVNAAVRHTRTIIMLNERIEILLKICAPRGAFCPSWDGHRMTHFHGFVKGWTLPKPRFLPIVSPV